MSRLLVSLLAPLLTGPVGLPQQSGGVWEKSIAPGLTYRMECEKDPSRVIHILRFNPSTIAVSVVPSLAGKTVFEAGPLKGRTTVSQMVKAQGAIAGINGDFFGGSGDPIGLMVSGGKLLSLPYPNRGAFAWGPAKAKVNIGGFVGSVALDDGTSVALEGLNEEAKENKVTLCTPEVGLPISKTPAAVLILKARNGELPPSTQFSAEVIARSSEVPSSPIGKGQLVLIARGDKEKAFAKVKVGSQLNLKLQTSGFDWESLDQAIAGGPILIREGKMAIAPDDEGFKFELYGRRHPRTAIGWTSKEEIIFVAIDGRQEVSVGATLTETAEILMRLGCREALNLDGGGSTVMNILGIPVNRPSEAAGERPVANGILFFGPKLPLEGEFLKWKLPSTLIVGASSDLVIFDEAQKPIPNAEIIWAMQGAAWIDQGGRVQAVNPGIAEVAALVRGKVIRGKITIVAKSK